MRGHALPAGTRWMDEEAVVYAGCVHIYVLFMLKTHVHHISGLCSRNSRFAKHHGFGGRDVDDNA